MEFTVVSVAAQSLWALSRWYEAFQREHPEAGVELTAYFIATGCPADTRKKLCADVEAADFVLIDLMGAPEDLINAVGAALEKCKGQRLVIGCGFHAVVFDAEQGPVRLGLSRELARRMNAPCLPLGK